MYRYAHKNVRPFSAVCQNNYGRQVIFTRKRQITKNNIIVVGILRFDVTEDRPQGVLLEKAYLNTKVAEAHSGVTYDETVKTALPMIVFE